MLSSLRDYVNKNAGDTLLASIIFVPAVLFMVSTENISELAGFGFSAKFKERLGKEISFVGRSLSDLFIYSLSDNDPDFKMNAFFEACSEYYVMRDSAVPTEKRAFEDYVVNASYAIRSSIACGRLVGVVVLDDNDKYIGSYSRRFFAESLSIWAVPTDGSPVDKKTLASMLRTMTIFGAALRSPVGRITPGEGFVAAMNEDATIEHAINKFESTDAEFLAMTDELGRFKGIVTYRDVIGSVLDAMVSSD